MPVPILTSEERHLDMGQLSETVQTIPHPLSGPPIKSMSYQFRDEELMWDKIKCFSRLVLSLALSVRRPLHVQSWEKPRPTDGVLGGALTTYLFLNTRQISLVSTQRDQENKTFQILLLLCVSLVGKHHC